MENIYFDFELDVIASYVDLLSWLADELDIQYPKIDKRRRALIIIGKALPINTREYYE